MFTKLFKKEGGFTLVELLVTIAILAVLFGITTLTLSGVGTNAKTTSCNAEKAVVQSAIDIYLAADSTDGTVTAGTAVKVDKDTADFGKYLRSESLATYTWSDTGEITAAVCP